MQRAIECGFEVRLLLAEHNLLSCQLMEAALEKNRRLSVVASVIAPEEFLETYSSLRPDVCVISGNLKDRPNAGFRLARELRALDTDSRVILLLESSEKSAVIEAFRSGAKGVFCRDEHFETLAKCIQKVHGGQVWANNEQLQYMAESLADATDPAIKDARGANLLTKRELSLVQLVAEGRTNRDISRELHLSEHTVRNYLFRIFNKLGTSSRLELALYAINRKTADHGQPSGQDI
jgi:two-component system nitrate/nitrite response regulator NarL